jgi:Zn finger protein HypA/HybF involved in hydrogenase expression
MNRKQRRSLDKHLDKKTAANLTEKISQFDKLPQQCNACQKEFDKKNKDMIQSWSVVVKQEVVRLFCPECIKTAKEILEKNGTRK